MPIRARQHVCTCREIGFRVIRSLSLLVLRPSIYVPSFLSRWRRQAKFSRKYIDHLTTRARVTWNLIQRPRVSVTYWNGMTQNDTIKIFTKHVLCTFLFLFIKIFAIQKTPVKNWFSCWHLNCFNQNYLHCELQNSLLVAHWFKKKIYVHIYEEREGEIFHNIRV